MKKIKLLAIAPYEGMAEIISALSVQKPDIDITVRVGNLHTGLKIAQELSSQDYDVILSRGGTADMIRKEIDLPVVDAQISVFDMLRSIKMAESYSGKFAIAGFQSITNCAHMLCDLLQLNIDIFTFESTQQVLPILKSLKEQDYQLVVCDMIGSITASELGLNSIMVPSGTESIASALEEAVKLVNTSAHVRKQKEIFQKALIYDNQDVIIYDPKGNLWFSSISNNELKSPILNMVQTYLPAFSKTDGQSFAKQVDKYLLTITNQHLYYDNEQYTLLCIQKKEALFQEEDPTISIYNKGDTTVADFTTYYNSANNVGSIQYLIDEYSSSYFPVLITGEVGTGKDKAAHLLYKNGPYQNAPYYVIDCNKINDKKWNSLMLDEKSPLNNLHTTIYFKNVETLSDSQFTALLTFLDHSELAKRNRLIFSLMTGSNEKSSIRNYLANQLSCLLLALLPLRERIEDIPSITTLYINELNASLGKQIVGFQPQAMDLMKNYSWPHNLDQLRRIIKQLVTITKTSYITEESVGHILKSEDISEYKALDVISSELDLKQTLDEITYDIIRIVLDEEKMNKEKTAKRLGISRSTLWRILKTHEN